MYTEEQKVAIWNFISGNAYEFPEYISAPNFDDFKVENTTIIEFLASKGYTTTFLFRNYVRRSDNFVIFINDTEIDLILILDLELNPIEVLEVPTPGVIFNRMIENDTGSGYIYYAATDGNYQEYYIVVLDDPILNKAIRGEYQVNLLNQYPAYQSTTGEFVVFNLIYKNETTNDFIIAFTKQIVPNPSIITVRKFTADTNEIVDYPLIGESTGIKLPYEMTYSFYNNEFEAYLYGTRDEAVRDTISVSIVRYKTQTYKDGNDDKYGLFYNNHVTYVEELSKVASIIEIKKYGDSIYIKSFYADDNTGEFTSQLLKMVIDEQYIYSIDKEDYTVNEFVPYIAYFTNNNLFYIKRIRKNDESNEIVKAAYVDPNSYFLVWKEIYNGAALNINLFNGLVINNFNLYKFKLMSKDFTMTGETQLIFDPNAYNGTPPSDIYLGNTVANQIALTSGGKAVFARDLYNKVISGNIMTSTVQIPNQVLNESQIDGQVMISQNNTEILKTNTYFEKNIFENVLFNIITALNIVDQNDLNNKLINQNASNIINFALQNINQYDTVKMVKARLTFDDSTTKIMQADTGYYPLEERGYASLNFFVPTGKKCIKVEFISNDENTLYVSKNIDLDGGKYYIIHQYVRIEEEMI